MHEIASQPIFRWIGKTDRNPERNTRVFLQRAAERAPGTVPGITVLAHHGESCKRGYRAVGASSTAATGAGSSASFRGWATTGPSWPWSPTAWAR